MELQFFSIRASDPNEDVLAALNQVLKSQHVVTIDRHLIDNGENSFWSICVTCAAGHSNAGIPTSTKKRIDYREVLNEQDFVIFDRLRTLRKELADKEGVPAYALFTNEHLAELVRGHVNSKEAMIKIPGVGDGRIEKYGDAFLQVLNYLNSLDRLLLENLPTRGIVRYMDDVIWWCDTKKDAIEAGRCAEEFLQSSLRLTIHPIQINRTSQGVTACGYRVFPGTIRLSQRRRKLYRLARKRWEIRYKRGIISGLQLQTAYASALGITLHADSRSWRQNELAHTPPLEACRDV